jgi:hypothetical protein
VRRGASWTAAYHVQPTVAAVARPVRSSMVPSYSLLPSCPGVVAHPDGICPAEPPAGIQRRASPWSAMPGRQPWRRSPVGVQHAVSNHPSGVVRGPAVRPSGVQPVRCSVTWVVVRGPAVRPVCCPPVHPSSPLVCPPVRCPTVQCPTVCCPTVGPDASVSSHTGRGVGTRLVPRGQPSPQEAVEVPVAAVPSSRSVDGPAGLGRRRCRGRTLVNGVAGAWPGGCGRGRPRVPAERPGRPGRRAEHLSLRLGCGRGSRRRREVAAPAARLPSWAGCATTVRGRRRA